MGHVRIFKNKSFRDLPERRGLWMQPLCGSDRTEPERGLIDADLGGGVIKQRIARPGREIGRISNDHSVPGQGAGFFVHGFAKNEQDNIRDDEWPPLEMLAAELMRTTMTRQSPGDSEDGTLTEVMCDD